MALLIRCGVILILSAMLAVLLLWAGNPQAAAAALLGGMIGAAIGESTWGFWRRMRHHDAP